MISFLRSEDFAFRAFCMVLTVGYVGAFYYFTSSLILGRYEGGASTFDLALGAVVFGLAAVAFGYGVIEGLKK